MCQFHVAVDDAGPSVRVELFLERHVVDDHQAPCSNSKLLCQPGLNDDLEELAVDLADPLGKWRKVRPTRVKWDEDRELAI